MLTPYLFPLEVAVVSFPLISLLAALPYLAYCYFRYGSLSVWRTVVLSSLVFYLLCAYYLVILPLPNPAEVATYTSPQFDWVPFNFIINISDSSFSIADPSTWLPLLTSMTFLEPFFNILLLMPFGAYLAYYFQKDWKKCLLYAFFLSFFFEMTQLSGLYGIYARPYRLFSVDDLMLNSLGGMIGYGVFFLLRRILPNRERIDQKSRARSGAVGYVRRIVAALVDVFLIVVLLVLAQKVFGLDTGSEYVFIAALSVYTLGFTLLTGGRTPGKALVKIRVHTVSEQGLRRVPALALRWIPRNMLLSLWPLFDWLMGLNQDWRLLWLVLFILLIALLVADMLYALRKRRRLWYERLSNTENISTFKVSADAQQ